MDAPIRQKTLCRSSSEFEDRMVELFGSVARRLGMPRSLGAIYGLLFASEQPLCMDRLMERLQISKGGVSMGLRQLREVGAVRVVKLEGDRRDFYLPELELRRLVRSLLQEKFIPHLEEGKAQLSELHHFLEGLPDDFRNHARTRLRKLENWHRRADGVVPLALQLLRD